MHELLVNRLFKPAQEKSVVRCTDCPAMTIAVDLGRKATKQTNKHIQLMMHITLSVFGIVHIWNKKMPVDYKERSRSLLLPWSQRSRSNMFRICLTSYKANSSFNFFYLVCSHLK